MRVVGFPGWDDGGCSSGVGQWSAELFGEFEPGGVGFAGGDVLVAAGEEFGVVGVKVVEDVVDVVVDFGEAFVEQGDDPAGEDEVQEGGILFESFDEAVDDVFDEFFVDLDGEIGVDLVQVGAIVGGGEEFVDDCDGVFCEWDVVSELGGAQPVYFGDAFGGVEVGELGEGAVDELLDEFGGVECFLQEVSFKGGVIGQGFGDLLRGCVVVFDGHVGGDVVVVHLGFEVQEKIGNRVVKGGEQVIAVGLESIDDASL